MTDILFRQCNINRGDFSHQIYFLIMMMSVQCGSIIIIPEPGWNLFGLYHFFNNRSPNKPGDARTPSIKKSKKVLTFNTKALI